MVPTQVHKFLFQRATTVVVPPLDELLPVPVLWQVCFFLTSCEPVRMRWSDLLCGQSPSLKAAPECVTMGVGAARSNW